GNSGQAARQEPRNAAPALGRKAGAYVPFLDLRRVPDKSRPDLCAGRSGRTARRPQRRALLRSARRDDKVHRHAFRDHYAQSDYDGAHESSVRCHDGRAWRVSTGVSGPGSRGSFPRGELTQVRRTLSGGIEASRRLIQPIGNTWETCRHTRSRLPGTNCQGTELLRCILAGRLPPYPPNSRLAKRPRAQARGLFLSSSVFSTEPVPLAIRLARG